MHGMLLILSSFNMKVIVPVIFIYRLEEGEDCWDRRSKGFLNVLSMTYSKNLLTRQNLPGN